MPGIADLRRRFQGGGMDAGAGSADKGFGAGVSKGVQDRMRDRDRGGGSNRPPGLFGSPGAAGSVGFTGTTVGAGPQFGGGGGQDPIPIVADPVMSEALVSAAPEVVEETANQATTGNVFTQGISNIYNRFINNPYAQTTSQYTFNPGLAFTFNPTKVGIGTGFLGLAGLTPRFEDDKLVSTGFFGSEYGNLKNALNPLNYEDVAKEDFDAMLNEVFRPDDSTKGYTVDFDAGEAEAQKLGFGPQYRFQQNPVFGEDDPSTPESESFNPESSVVKDLEKNLGLDDGSIGNFKDFADAKRELDRKMGGGDQRGSPANLVSNIGADGGAGGGTGGGTGTDTSPTYNDFTEAQKATVDKMTGVLGYDMQYAINYILGGGPTF